MIKLNLNKTKTSIEDSSIQESSIDSTKSSMLETIQTVLEKGLKDTKPIFFIKIVINIMLILAFPLGLKIYEIQEINKLSAQKQKEELLLTQTTQQLNDLKAELDSYGYLKQKSEEFIRKKQFLKTLTEERLIIPRILDFIQNNLPNTVWLKQIQVDISNKERKSVTISGESIKEVGVNTFAVFLEEILDTNSITVSMRDIKEGNTVIKVSFDLRGKI
ncbi:MAG: hypothetical protein OXC37_03060 [Bdellovibrionaceae bacterium]|nr:hypothetical protein [Pseudobdellovibrionaceae bacterium]